MERGIRGIHIKELEANQLWFPPRVILVFDNWRGSDKNSLMLGEKTMQLRAAIAAKIFHSTLYSKPEQKPQVICFAGEHKKGFQAGSSRVEEYLIKFGIPRQNIETRNTTNTTTTDITQLHSFLKEKGISGSVAIITTNDHVARTNQEIQNHFSRHKKRPQHLQFNVIGPSSPVLIELQTALDYKERLEFGYEIEYQIEQAIKNPADFDHGLTEKVAYRLSKHRLLKPLQTLAETVNHQHTPEALKRIKRLKRQFRGGRKNLYVKRGDRKPKMPYILPPC
jgi:hypothetical protein